MLGRVGKVLALLLLLSLGFLGVPYYEGGGQRYNSIDYIEPCKSGFDKVECVGGGGVGKAPNVPNVPARIIVTEERLGHIERYHGAGTQIPGRSRFIEGVDIPALIKQAEGVAPKPQSKYEGRYERIADAGHSIGITQAGVETSVYTVITDAQGYLVNAFPGVP